MNPQVYPLDSLDTRVNTIKPKQRIPSISSSSVPRTKRLNLSLRILTSSNGILRGITNVDELIADAVGDDVGVQGLLLALGDERVLGDEGELVGWASVESADEGHGGLTGAEVEVTGAGAGSSVTTRVFFCAIVDFLSCTIVDFLASAIIDFLVSAVINVCDAAEANPVGASRNMGFSTSAP